MHSINAVYSNDWGSWAINQPDITFTVRDFEGVQPHEDDPIVVMLRIADYEIERVLLDQGSSADLIYGDAFEKLGLTESDLLPYDGALVGFSGEKVYVRGYVELNTVFGKGKNAESFSIKFLVVKCTSPYNVLIGRPSLNRLEAIISTRHLTAKYPLSKGGVGILKADQLVARKCYSESFKQYGHLGKKAVKEGHRVYEVEVEQAEVSLDPRDGFLDHKMTSEEETKAIEIGKRSLKVGVNLTASQEDRLVKLLSQNMDLFAWSAKDLPGIDPKFICHKLALNPGAKPIVQFKRKMGEEKTEAVKVETNKLLEAGFIREVKYPTWLVNVVMVKKANGKWRMCTDYTDLNKHCPKDSYPLPNIDKLVDRASGFGMLSLMDAYSGYHQIRMYQPDEEKTAFMTNQANYCYQTMPFGLKNADATYQRLMDKVFDKQVGRNMEIYVDDMVVKSEEVLGHCSDLKEAFGELRKHNMRLNPEKCSFGIQSGKFLGFMITRRGIEVNPDKCKAILEMQSPTSVKDVQKLTGRIAALSRFLPCSGNKSAPFFQCLRKNKAFQWTKECESAFQSLKEHLSSPPVLSKPVPVLLQEIKGDVKIIYFVSHALQGAEVRYQKIEKAALALIISARKLRPYFQGFPVVVKTDLPLRQVLQQPDLAGRMVSWAVELLEFGITFEKKGEIKAQVLVDFVNEMYHEDNSEAGEWSLSVDGSSNVKGSGAEYEAIIAGLKLAIEMGVKSITIKTDSQIVSRQIQGEYQAKDAQLAKYLVKAQGLITQIGEVKINHVPRDENTRVDILSKLASTKKPGNNKSVIQEVLNSPSIEADEVMAVPAITCLDWMGRVKKCLEAEGAELAMFTKDQIREASHYTLLGDQLYRRGVGVPLLRCVSEEDAERIMFEVHEGVCASHIGGRSLAAKVLRAGFYWPTLRSDCMDYVKKCDKCQIYADLHRAPPEELSSMSSSWPFAMWGVDILGPFTPAGSQVRYVLVAVDYFTKWIEAKSMARITAEKVKRFYWRKLICRFGVPATIVSDNGTQFTSRSVKSFCSEMGIELRFASVEHPQSNGQVESANKVVLNGLKKRLGEAKGLWADELLTVIWAYNTTPQSTTGETPFKLAYGVDAMIPAEVQDVTFRVATYSEDQNDANRLVDINLVEETQAAVRLRQALVKQRSERRYNSRVVPRQMKVGDLVLRRKAKGLDDSKLSPNWEGPYRILRELGQGAYHLEELSRRRIPRAWNAQHLRYYYS
ncbi:uncharacterized protein LOC130744604 [Lotus japonicus]|uniref:uncharacterized protein LOC130744604 n=1 Tax=Lotus japonicus TaxID=34305 RepID=UPI00258F69A9|nr:uncharacterized protein LOC130744604 [Lotus japonicus]